MLWQLVQPTLALACGERMKSGCAPEWQLRHLASTSLRDPLAGSKILVMSPPLDTCSLPAPWQFSQVTPFAFPCIKAIFVCGLVAKFLASSAWQVAQVSAPTNSACAAGVAGVAGFGGGSFPAGIAFRPVL